MKTVRRVVLLLSLAAAAVLGNPLQADSKPAWETRQLLPEFYAEGASIGDLNGDGKVDIAYGPFWFAGPDFAEPQRFSEGEPFIADKGYSDNFFSFIHDVTGDGNADILIYGFPGKEARLYVNPGKEKLGGLWPMHQVVDQICNESPYFIDLIPGGQPEIVCARDTAYGYYQAGDDATQPWTWHAISEVKEAAKPFGHGLGVGDVNGDGRLDVVEKMHWYEQPESGDGLWTKHRWALVPYGGGGAQILVDDVDGDGDADLISSLQAHAYGMSWFEQYEPGKFERHDILGETSTDNPYGVCFSQIHAMDLADMNGDGRMDIVTGKRFMAHQGKDPGAFQEPVVYVFYNTEKDGAIDFVPELVHNDSGVGVEVNAVDLNGDGALDIVSGNKKGLAIHLQTKRSAVSTLDPWKVPGGRSQDDYGSGLNPQEAVAKMTAPEGFTVELVAGEPQVVQPIAMCFDARGRIWVVEGGTYPERAPEGEGKDRILIFEDADGDGSLETRKVFAERVNLASGIEVGFGGVYVGAAPYLLFYPDKDGDDVPDAEPEVLLDGWGYQDTHETLNSFTWGPDGWLYGTHGVFTHSKVGKPGAPEEERVPLNAGVWRFHPVTQEFEVYAHGTSNPWGVDFNEYGDFFVSACVIPHFYHMAQGGRYQRQGGQHFNPYTFDDIKTIADHAHYVGSIRDHAYWGDNKITRPPAPLDTSALGGGHAHAGLAFYLDDKFPENYRGHAYFHNLHGHRLIREVLEKEGSGYIARHRPDLVLANNHDYIGVGVMLGPDGALYFSDWVDPQTCHHRDVEAWDRSNGRIYRTFYGEGTSPAMNLPGLDNQQLVATLGSANAVRARQAQRLLQERSVQDGFDAKALSKALAAFEGKHADNVPLRLRAFWAAHTCGLLSTDDLEQRLADSSEYIRGWALQFLGESEEPLPAKTLSTVEALAMGEPSQITRRYLASLMQRLPFEQRWKIAEGLIARHKDAFDRNLQLLTWYGIEPLVDEDTERAFALINKTQWPQLREFIMRRGAVTQEGRSAIMQSLAKAPNAEAYAKLASQLLETLQNLPSVTQPEGWDAAKARGEALASKDPAIAERVGRLGVRFGDPAYFEKYREIARDNKLQSKIRIEALELLVSGRDKEAAVIAREELDRHAFRQVALEALRLDTSPQTAEALVAHLDQFNLQQRNQAINLLAARPKMALVLLKAVDEDRLPSSTISPVLLDQFERFENEEINAIIEKNWTRGTSGVDLEKLAAAIDSWKAKLNPKVLAKADASEGRRIYMTSCGTCHTLFGEGIALGPDLTGSNRGDLGYVLENVLSPSAVVGKDYLLNIFTMKDGSVISGMIKEHTDEYFKVSMPGGSVVDVRTADVADRQEMAQSLMPPGLFDTMPVDQVAHLVKYLASPIKVPMPGAAKPSVNVASSVLAPAKGVTRVEGEALAEHQEVTGGNAREQVMTNFGPSWSGNKHLWWTGAKPGDTLTLVLPEVPPGTHDLTLYPTAAKDYGQVKVLINGQIRETDLYNPEVVPADPLQFEKVNVSPGEPLKIAIQILGANPEAKPSYMVGIDRVEISPAK